jgi:two-component system OmpR family response regulator
MKSRNTILLLEDDTNLGFILTEHLEMNGFTVTHCGDGESGIKSFQHKTFDLCLVDVMMPKKDGFTFAREALRINPDVPFIFLTAKSLKQDRIEGLKIGADDYVTKPFSMEELLLRIRAVLKRTIGTQRPETKETQFRIGIFAFDSAKRILRGKERTEKKLTSKESDLLRILAEHKNEVVDRALILQRVWENDSYYNARSMDVYISKLRKYLKADPSITIENSHGRGYALMIGTDTRL